MKQPRNTIAIFVPGLYGGGAEHVMVRLANGLADRGFAVDLILARAEGPYLSEVSDAVRLVDLHASRVLFCILPLVRYLKEEHPRALISVLHSNLIALWAKRLANVPTRVVVSERCTLSLINRGKQDVRAQIFPFLDRLFYPWADAIVPVSHGVADDLVNELNLRPDRVHVIYNPLNTSELSIKLKEPLAHAWFEPGEPPVILAAGRLTTAKDYPTLLRAFMKVKQKCPARLLILGEGEERAALERLIKQSGLEEDISLPGFVKNPYPFMARSAVYVLSSITEGLPNTLIEAMYCGTRLVATDCPHGPREILADGKYGRLVPVGDADALAEAIEAALDGEVDPPPAESWRSFELDKIVDQYLEVLVGKESVGA